MTITVTIPGEPVGKGRPKFTKAGTAYTPPKTRAYENKVAFLYKLAAKETREVVSGMCKLVIDHCPEFSDVLVPACKFNGKCHEMRPCGKQEAGQCTK